MCRFVCFHKKKVTSQKTIQIHFNNFQILTAVPKLNLPEFPQKKQYFENDG